MSDEPIVKNVDITKYRRFENFRGVIEEFNKFNLLYGWNYSGKTTLSRIFAAYNGTLDHIGIDKDADFKLSTLLGALDLSATDKLKIHVFNSDYIEQNLFFESTSTSNVIVVSDKATDIITKINDLKNKRLVSINNHSRFKNQLKDYNEEYADIRKEYSKRIDEIITERFNASNIQAVEKTLDSRNLNQYILNRDDLNSKIKTIKNPTKYRVENLIDNLYSVNLDNFYSLITKTVTPSEIIKQLAEKHAVDWVKDGLEINKSSEFCVFCNSPLDKDRIDYLDKAFKSEFDELGNLINNYKNQIQEYCKNIPSPASIVDDYQNEYNTLHKMFIDNISIYNQKNKAIKRILNAKYQHRDIGFKSEININIDDINSIIEQLNNIIIKHNDFVNNEVSAKQKIIEDIKASIISELLLDPRYINSQKHIEDSNIGIRSTQKEIDQFNMEITTEETKISDVKKGANEINKILSKLFLNKSNIKLEVVQGHNNSGDPVDITKLYRGDGQPALNLSEGEKTAIAFAHYYTKLQDSINKKIAKDEVLFIDDPISSLDKNHIYAVSILIKELIDKFNQSFVTTHNFELYRLLKYKNGSTIANYYYVKRDGDKSVITDLPNELKNHDTEYDFLFSLLYKFKQDNSSSDLYLIGHCTRRFLDTYLQFKIPNNYNPCDKLKALIKDIKEDDTKYTTLYRIVNDESHIHPEIIFDKSFLEGAVNLLLSTLETYDTLHYNTLLKSCV